jgi:hypothetical protein
MIGIVAWAAALSQATAGQAAAPCRTPEGKIAMRCLPPGTVRKMTPGRPAADGKARRPTPGGAGRLALPVPPELAKTPAKP